MEDSGTIAKAGRPDTRGGTTIIAFGIACCAWMMVMVAAVALALL